MICRFKIEDVQVGECFDPDVVKVDFPQEAVTMHVPVFERQLTPFTRSTLSIDPSNLMFPISDRTFEKMLWVVVIHPGPDYMWDVPAHINETILWKRTS